MSDEPVSKRVKTPSILVMPQSCESGFTMDFNTFVQDGYEVYVEGGGPQGWAKRRLDVVARWKAMGVTSEAVTKYVVEHTAFSRDDSSLIKVVSAYELYASVKLVAVDGALNFVPDTQVTRIFRNVVLCTEFGQCSESSALLFPAPSRPSPDLP